MPVEADIKEYNHKYYLDNMEIIKERGKRFYREHEEEFKERANKRAWYKEHPKIRALVIKKCQKKLKEEVLTHYGEGKLACVRCNFADVRALSIDHINGNGYQHRKELKRRGVNLYTVLRQQNYPEGYQTLCMNCNFIKREEDKECLKLI